MTPNHEIALTCSCGAAIALRTGNPAIMAHREADFLTAHAAHWMRSPPDVPKATPTQGGSERMSDETYLLNSQGAMLQPLAYRGMKGCWNVTCTNLSFDDLNDPERTCYGWHCASCHTPCSSQGHPCTTQEEADG